MTATAEASSVVVRDNEVEAQLDDPHGGILGLCQTTCRLCPPSTTSSKPVMNGAWSETRNERASAISVGFPRRLSINLAASRGCVTSSSIGVSTGPGNTAFTRMPDDASLAAAIWVSPRNAPWMSRTPRGEGRA
jgi:hypothetical protein